MLPNPPADVGRENTDLPLGVAEDTRHDALVDERLLARDVDCERLADVVVLGHEAARVRETIPTSSMAVVHNSETEQGRSTSVARRVTWARRWDADAALFALGDIPCLASTTYEAVLTSYRRTRGDAVIVERDGRRGNLVCFDSSQFDALDSVEGDSGGRRLLADLTVE